MCDKPVVSGEAGFSFLLWVAADEVLNKHMMIATSILKKIYIKNKKDDKNKQKTNKQAMHLANMQQIAEKHKSGLRVRKLCKSDHSKNDNCNDFQTMCWRRRQQQKSHSDLT